MNTTTIGKITQLNNAATQARARLDSMAQKPKLVKREQPKREHSPEREYIQRLIDSATPIVITLDNGSEISCRVEWVDRFTLLIVDICDGQEAIIWKHALRMLRPVITEAEG